MQQNRDWTRRDLLLSIEKKYQEEWEEARLFEVDPSPDPECSKYFMTFPYPYMNGLLHLGHAFSFSKTEFSVGYHRLKGKRVLMPFGFHVTGMPIAACAQKLRNEMDTFGNPPVFPEPEAVEKDVVSDADKVTSGKFSGKKGKKAGQKPQWEIMKDMGIAPERISLFADTATWLNEFPPQAIEDLQLFGAKVDFRRSFITTEQNPFYDSFIKWQFRHLRAGNLLEFGKRPTIYSPSSGQPCQDHDRASGEGVGIQEYVLIKLEVQSPSEQSCFKSHACVAGRRVFFLAATLRPETMYGQTNCWVLPSGEYSAYELDEESIIITTERAATNLAWQHVIRHHDQTPPKLFTIMGEQLIGLPLSSPHSPYPTIYALPMFTISMYKGTGIVTSVPSDAPDDYQALIDLKKKPDYREKLGIKDEWIMPFEVVPIIDIPGFGNQAAVTLCEQMKIQSQKDQERLAEAKATVYLKGFNDGVMITNNEWKGVKVKDAKPQIRKLMLEQGVAIQYFEPEKEVVSRLGDTCVVATVDQWFLKYGAQSPEWQAKVKDHIENTLETYLPGTKRGFVETADWLGDWACSRTFGLGTSLPFEGAEGYLIDSLSDSTIYMAYYTVAHYLQSGARYNGLHPQKDGSHLNLDGRKPSPFGIKPEQMTHDVWNYIFLGEPSLETLDSDLDKDLLQRMRNEFLFWYPMDLRCSGKDLIQNHLTMSLYNHAAVFPEHHWPRSFFCNGHVLVDGCKMSKSQGNFMTLRNVIKDYSADATRLALADAGDGLDDANFVLTVVNAQILKLTKELEWMKETLTNKELRTGGKNFFDQVFENQINKVISDADRQYSAMMFREAVQNCWYGLQNLRDEHRVSVDRLLHRDLAKRFVEVQALLVSPIAPHWAEHVWKELLGNTTSIHTAAWPTLSAPVHPTLQLQADYLTNTIHTFRAQIAKQVKKTKVNPQHGVIFVVTGYQDWQVRCIAFLAQVVAEVGEIPKDLSKRVAEDPVLKTDMKRVMAFLAFMKELLPQIKGNLTANLACCPGKRTADGPAELSNSTIGADHSGNHLCQRPHHP
eukprot:NODE_81_length_3361_cov_87.229437_g75_i0.p1 GENE.NODE_81_length_3361_cov_87.229437_g75_i0~~NODE_81_length_3361_cov_87.229437_g75_i0.p1  ORF type:complete len:1054 (+),score=260.59 NODE_81_length_3361_cov_87.229437_g75_i0:105-3266(+)